MNMDNLIQNNENIPKIDNNLNNSITEYFTNLNIIEYIFYDNFNNIKIKLNTFEIVDNINKNQCDIFIFLVNYINRQNIISGLSVKNIKLYDMDTETIINSYKDIKKLNINSDNNIKNIKIIITPIIHDHN
jgi:hypothetical protein